MTPEELKQFRKEVADPRMREIFAKTEIPDGACFIDSVHISFLDGRSHGVDSVIEASGLSYINGDVQEYRYEMPDASVEEFVVEHKDCVFISDGKLHVFDELDGFEVNTELWNYGRCAKVFDDLKSLEQLQLASEPFAYLKLKAILAGDPLVQESTKCKGSFAPGNFVDVLIADCCEGLAKVLDISESGMTLELVPGQYFMIYPNTSLDSNILRIPMDDILEIESISQERLLSLLSATADAPHKEPLSAKIQSAFRQASQNTKIGITRSFENKLEI